MKSDLERLRDLPTLGQHANARDPAPAARAEFDRAFGRAPRRGALGFAAQAAVPVGLAGIVGIYLMWAFSAAIALYK